MSVRLIHNSPCDFIIDSLENSKPFLNKMEQPLDFSKSTQTMKSTKSFVKKSTVSRFSTTTPKSIKNFNNDYHSHNSENSDENTSRSSASSPDSLVGGTEQVALNLNSGHNTLSQQALLMLAAVSNPNLAAMNFNAQQLINSTSDLKTNFMNQFNAMTAQTNSPQTNVTSNFLLNSPNLNNSAAHAAAVCVSNMMNQQQQTNQSFNSPLLNQSNQTNKSKSNQTKSSKASSKAVSRKSMIIAKQQEDEQKSNESAIKFGILSNSQNVNILQLDADLEENSSPSNNSLQLSINSNMSGEENSLYNEMFGPDDGSSPRSQRRRGNPIPESLKDDSYWNRRRKNNEAAKKSRDAKRAKDLVTAKRAVILENENSQLKSQLNQIRNENLILRSFLGEESFYDENHKRQIDDLLLMGRKVDPEKVRTFAHEFFKVFGSTGQHRSIERMES